jgi:hypothetical protein
VADSFATTFWVGFALMLATLIPAFFLPRRRAAAPAGGAAQEAAPPVMIH